MTTTKVTTESGKTYALRGNGLYISPTTPHPIINITGDLAEAIYLAVSHRREHKPWHDAKPGEVWILTVDGDDFAWGVGAGEWAGMFKAVAADSVLALTSPEIGAGRRIYELGDTV